MEPQKPETPAEREAAKTSQQRAEDWAYTMLHAGVCTATDIGEPALDNWFQKWLGIRFPRIFGCGGHEHHGHEAHDHHHHHDNNLWRWYLGEFGGDILAVPATMAFQRFLPGVMHGIQNVMEPALGSFFRKGAERGARKWAEREGVSLESQAFKDRVQEIYQYEINHLPQALMWTASSIAINLSIQKLAGNKAPLLQIGAAKTMGAGLNSALVVGARSFMPETVRQWDKVVSRKVIRPIAKAMGIDKEFEQTLDKEDLKNGDWAGRLADSKTPPQHNL